MGLNSDNKTEIGTKQENLSKKIEEHMKHISSFTFLTLFGFSNFGPDKIIEILERSRNNK